MFTREVAPANSDNVIACLQQAGIHPHTRHAARQWLTVMALVSAGQGVALVPACMLWIEPFFCLSKKAPVGAFLIPSVQIDCMR